MVEDHKDPNEKNETFMEHEEERRNEEHVEDVANKEEEDNKGEETDKDDVSSKEEDDDNEEEEEENNSSEEEDSSSEEDYSSDSNDSDSDRSRSRSRSRGRRSRSRSISRRSRSWSRRRNRSTKPPGRSRGRDRDQERRTRSQSCNGSHRHRRHSGEREDREARGGRRARSPSRSPSRSRSRRRSSRRSRSQSWDRSRSRSSSYSSDGSPCYDRHHHHHRRHHRKRTGRSHSENPTRSEGTQAPAAAAPWTRAREGEAEASTFPASRVAAPVRVQLESLPLGLLHEARETVGVGAWTAMVRGITRRHGLGEDEQKALILSKLRGLELSAAQRMAYTSTADEILDFLAQRKPGETKDLSAQVRGQGESMSEFRQRLLAVASGYGMIVSDDYILQLLMAQHMDDRVHAVALATAGGSLQLCEAVDRAETRLRQLPKAVKPATMAVLNDPAPSADDPETEVNAVRRGESGGYRGDPPGPTSRFARQKRRRTYGSAQKEEKVGVSGQW